MIILLKSKAEYRLQLIRSIFSSIYALEKILENIIQTLSAPYYVVRMFLFIYQVGLTINTVTKSVAPQPCRFITIFTTARHRLLS
jgi:hypothetical protein